MYDGGNQQAKFHQLSEGLATLSITVGSPIMNLDLSSLRSVIAAAEHGSFRQAATALNIKQSALSRRIRHLEGQLGVSLFERSSGGVRLTPAGASMAQASRRLFGEIDEMVRAGS
jgi:DNA-binding transcriptional LysR family regulator